MYRRKEKTQGCKDTGIPNSDTKSRNDNIWLAEQVWKNIITYTGISNIIYKVELWYRRQIKEATYFSVNKNIFSEPSVLVVTYNGTLLLFNKIIWY